MSYKRKSEGGVHRMPAESGIFGLLRPIYFMMIMTLFASGCTKEENPVNVEAEQLKAAGINEVIPANQADSVAVNPILSVTFLPGTDPSKISAATFTLKNSSSSVPGKTTISGTTASFTPATDLAAATEYTASVKFGKSGASKGSDAGEYTWKFKTGRHHHNSSLSVVSTDPQDKATAVPAGAQVIVTFNQEVPASMRTAALVVLKTGQSVVEGSLSYSGSTAIFKPSANLAPGIVYSGKVRIGSGSHDGDDDKSGDNYYWSFTTAGGGNDVTAPTVISVVPANNGTSVSTGSAYKVTFSEPMNPATITSASITLKQGAVAIAGTVAYSGVTATFTPSAPLAANTVYTGTVTTAVKDVAGNALAANYTSGFTTEAAVTDVTAPTVLSVTPANSASSVSTGSGVSVTFSEPMNASTVTSTTFTLKQGSSSVAGAVSCSGSGATFVPSAALAAGTVYTGTITTGAKDVAGNAIAANYSWSFTTAAQADVTAPTVSSVTPLSNATGVAVNSKPAVTFSEAMNAATITSSTFTLKQGSTVVAGNVTYSGTTATFTPSAALAGGTVYTGTVTTGAQDASGNALASSYTWTFTTVAATVVVSFATDVMPVLGLCNNCHTHGWTTSTNASTFYTNLVSGGYVNTSSPATSKMYTKLTSGHPGGSSISTTDLNKVLNWFTEGAKNN
jgi:hypothetical protein